MTPEIGESAFYEVSHALAITSNGKDTLFGGCAITHDLGKVPPNNSGQKRKNRASAKVGTYGSAVS
jgi:hypothetical protein